MSPTAAAQPISNKTKAMKEKPSMDDDDIAFWVGLGAGLICLASVGYSSYSIINSGYLVRACAFIYDAAGGAEMVRLSGHSVAYALNMTVVGALLYLGSAFQSIMEKEMGCFGRFSGSFWTTLFLAIFFPYITLFGVFRPTTMRFLTLVVREKESDKTKIVEEQGVKVSAVTQTIAKATAAEENKGEQLEGLCTPPEEIKVNSARDDISDAATEPFVEV